MRLWILASLAAVLGLTAMALAKPSYVKDFASTYAVKKTSALGKAGCGACHVGSTAKLNPFGVDLQKAMAKDGSKTCSPAVMKKVEGMDSDKDGKSNLDELKAGTLPGDPKSK